jgi:hypothetical protein
MQNGDVESLLTRQARSDLPMARQLLLYLDPFALFKDASRGPAYLQERARSYNQRMRWILVPYIQRWSLIAGALFLCIAPTEALAAKESLYIVPAAAFAVGSCIAITVTACTVAAYLLLSASRSH